MAVHHALTATKPQLQQQRQHQRQRPQKQQQRVLLVVLFAIITLTTAVAGPPPSRVVVAVAGEPTLLPCDTSARPGEDVHNLVLVFKDGRNAPIYSWDSRPKISRSSSNKSSCTKCVDENIGSRAHFWDLSHRTETQHFYPYPQPSFHVGSGYSGKNFVHSSASLNKRISRSVLQKSIFINPKIGAKRSLLRPSSFNPKNGRKVVGLSNSLASIRTNFESAAAGRSNWGGYLSIGNDEEYGWGNNDETLMARVGDTKVEEDSGNADEWRPLESGLALNPVRTSDAGSYLCRVDFMSSPTRNTFIELKVLEPITSLTIRGFITGSSRRDYTGDHHSTSAVSSEAAESTSTDESQTSVEILSTKLYNSSSLLDLGLPLLTGDISTNYRPQYTSSSANVPIKNSGQEHEMARASVEEERVREASFHRKEGTAGEVLDGILIDSNKKEPWRSKLSDRTIDTSEYRTIGPYPIGEELLLQCEVIHGAPSPIVTWLEDDRQVAPSSRTEGQRRSSISYRVMVLSVGDIGRLFSCVGENSALTPIWGDTIRLEVAVPVTEVKMYLDPKSELTSGGKFVSNWSSRNGSVTSFSISEDVINSLIHDMRSSLRNSKITNNMEETTIMKTSAKHPTTDLVDRENQKFSTNSSGIEMITADTSTSLENQRIPLYQNSGLQILTTKALDSSAKPTETLPSLQTQAISFHTTPGATTFNTSNPSSVDISQHSYLSNAIPNRMEAIALSTAKVLESNGSVLFVKEGATSMLTCETGASRPAAVIDWSLDGLPVPDHTVHERHYGSSISPHLYTTRSTLQLLSTAALHGSLVQCTVAPSLLQQQQVEQESLHQHQLLQASVTVNVLYSPHATLRLGGNASLEDIRENTSLTLFCDVHANPPLQGDITFYRDSKELHNEPALGHRELNTSLTVFMGGPEWSGSYSCSGSNTLGTTTSSPLHIRVNFAPRCSEPHHRSYSSRAGNAINLSCTVASQPRPFAFRWYIVPSDGSAAIALPRSSHSDHGRSSSLHYTAPLLPPYPVIQCYADNTVGDMLQPCLITILPAAVPEPVQGCTIYEGEEDHNSVSSSLTLGATVTINCNPGRDGGLNQSFTLEVQPNTNLEARPPKSLYLSPHSKFIVHGLHFGEDYTFTVTASNPRGLSPSHTMTYSVDEKERQSSRHSATVAVPQHMTPFLLVTLGAMVLVITCSAIALFSRWVYRKNKQRKRKFANREFMMDTTRAEYTRLQRYCHPSVVHESEKASLLRLCGVREGVACGARSVACGSGADTSSYCGDSLSRDSSSRSAATETLFWSCPSDTESHKTFRHSGCYHIANLTPPDCTPGEQHSASTLICRDRESLEGSNPELQLIGMCSSPCSHQLTSVSPSHHPADIIHNCNHNCGCVVSPTAKIKFTSKTIVASPNPSLSSHYSIKSFPKSPAFRCPSNISSTLPRSIHSKCSINKSSPRNQHSNNSTCNSNAPPLSPHNCHSAHNTCRSSAKSRKSHISIPSTPANTKLAITNYVKLPPVSPESRTPSAFRPACCHSDHSSQAFTCNCKRPLSACISSNYPSSGQSVSPSSCQSSSPPLVNSKPSRSSNSPSSSSCHSSPIVSQARRPSSCHSIPMVHQSNLSFSIQPKSPLNHPGRPSSGNSKSPTICHPSRPSSCNSNHPSSCHSSRPSSVLSIVTVAVNPNYRPTPSTDEEHAQSDFDKAEHSPSESSS